MSKNSGNRKFYYEDSADGSYTFSLKAAYKPIKETRSCQSWPSEEWGGVLSASQNYAVRSGSAGPDSQTGTESNFSPEISSGSIRNWPVESQVFANAGPDRVAIAGADTIFEGKAYGLKKEPLENARYSWNFGDGAAAEGKTVSHAYSYPGDYIAVLDVSSGYFSGTDRLTVKVEQSKIAITSLGSAVKPGLELSNGSGFEVDISSWILRGATTTFSFPPRTFIAPGKKIYLSSGTLGFAPHLSERAELLYPNGSVSYLYEKGKVAVSSALPVPLSPAAPKGDNRSMAAVTSKVGDFRAAEAAALPLAVPEPKEGGLSPWLMGVGALAFLGVMGVIAAKFPPRQSGNDNGTKSTLNARDFKIIEEK